MKRWLVPAGIALVAFGLGQLVPSVYRPRAAPRTIYLASVIWRSPAGGMNTAAVFCSADGRGEAADKMASTFRVKYPGAVILSIEANPIPDDLIEEVCRSRTIPAFWGLGEAKFQRWSAPAEESGQDSRPADPPLKREKRA